MQPMAVLSRGPIGPTIRAVVLTASLSLPAATWPLDIPATRATLKGIPTVEVIVEHLRPEAERDGLTRALLQREVEDRLREAGIRVAPAAPEYLYLAVQTTKGEGDLYAYVIRLQLAQSVTLSRKPQITSIAPTWSVTSNVGMVRAAQLSGVRSEVAGLVSRFISAYLEQNPKQ